jgi:DNA-binding NarL/FixJ family response regulator
MNEKRIVIVSRSEAVWRFVRDTIAGIPGRYDFTTISTERELEAKFPSFGSSFIFFETCFCYYASASVVAGYLRKFPRCNMTVFTGSADPPQRHLRFLYWGVKSFINFRSSPEEFQKGLERILRGGTFIPPKLEEAAADSQGLSVPSVAPFLTPREIEIIRYMAEGYTEQEIGKILGLSKKTVKNHKAHIYEKCNVHNAVRLMKFAFNRKIIGADDLRN